MRATPIPNHPSPATTPRLEPTSRRPRPSIECSPRGKPPKSVGHDSKVTYRKPSRRLPGPTSTPGRRPLLKCEVDHSRGRSAGVSSRSLRAGNPIHSMVRGADSFRRVIEGLVLGGRGRFFRNAPLRRTSWCRAPDSRESEKCPVRWGTCPEPPAPWTAVAEFSCSPVL